MSVKQIANKVFSALGVIVLMFIALFFLSTAFPCLSNKAAIKIRALKLSSTAIIDSVKIEHNDHKITPTVTFYYHFTPAEKTDTVIYGKTDEKFANNFWYTADKLKAEYEVGSVIPVFYKIRKISGRYASCIYPRTSFFEWNSFLLSGFIEFFILLFIICFSICYLLLKGEIVGIFQQSFFLSIFLFLILLLFYLSSPRLQREIFKQTHSEFIEVESTVHDWEQKYRRKSGRGSYSYHYVTAKFTYDVNGVYYQNYSKPVKVYSLINEKNIVRKELERLKNDHNTIAYVDKQNPEYAVLFASNRHFYMFSTSLAPFFTGMVILLLIMIVVVLLLNPDKWANNRKRTDVKQVLKILLITIVVTAVIIVGYLAYMILLG